jgi:hypothetical protein
MTPLVFALVFVVLESLIAIFAVCLVYIRMKSKVEEIHDAGHVPNRLELAGRLVAAYEAVQKTAGEPGAEAMLGGTGRQMVIDTLRGLAARLAAGDAVAPLYCDQLIRLCSDLAGVAPVAAAETNPAAGTPDPALPPAVDPPQN